MHPLSKLSDEELLAQTARTAKSEQEHTLLLLKHLAEIDSRRLFASKGFPSLWHYVRSLGYSESSASERVNALKLMTALPQVEKEIQAGELNLTAASRLQRFIRMEQKEGKRELKDEEKLELLETVKGKPLRQVDQILASQSSVQPMIREVERAMPSKTLGDLSSHGAISPPVDVFTRLSFTVDQSFMKQLERVRELKGRHLQLKDVFELTLRHYLKAVDPLQKQPRRPLTEKVLCANKVGKQTRTIPASVRKAVAERAGGRCEFIDPSTKRRCDARHYLQWEHVVPHARGGVATLENIELICFQHNRLRAERVFGREFIANKCNQTERGGK